MSRHRPPTIVDVAAAAGVSKSAVSRALNNGAGYVSPATKARIERVAQDLGYVPNAMAKGLRSQTRTIGLVLRDLRRPFYAWLEAGIQAEAERHGYQILVMTSAKELEMADALKTIRSLMSLQVDGIVLASARLPSDQIVSLVERIPIVVAGRRETSRSLTSVFCDDADGGAVLSSHLLRFGHARVGILLVDQEYSLSQHTRGRAMIERLEAAGATAVVWNIGSDSEAAAAVESNYPGSGVTAVMCPTDTAAVHVLEHFRIRGVKAPHDVTVTGYDGSWPFSAPYLGLTTFRQPVEEIGRTAVDLLIEKIEGTSTQERLVSLRGELIEGRTAGAVPAKLDPRPSTMGTTA